MFIRWEKRKRKVKRLGEEPKITLYAVLVANYRKGGRVHQRVIKKLALIRQEYLQYPIPTQIFWEKMSQKLEGLGIEKEKREDILANFSKKITESSAEDSQSDRSSLVREF